MALTAQQQTTLKAHIDASGDLNIFPNTSDGAFAIAALLNQPADPDFWVWRTSVTEAEIMQNGFDWVRVDNLSVGKARIMDWMFRSTGTINPSRANIRAGIIECWKGTQADLAVQAAIFGRCQRLATRFEKLFASGAGTSVVNGVGPATMAVEGSVSYQDVQDARNS
jgi:hypothetical protein